MVPIHLFWRNFWLKAAEIAVLTAVLNAISIQNWLIWGLLAALIVAKTVYLVLGFIGFVALLQERRARNGSSKNGRN